MMYATRWGGYDNHRRFATPEDKNGITWQLRTQVLEC